MWRRRGASTFGDGSLKEANRVSSTGGLVVAWMFQNEGDFLELVGCPPWKTNGVFYSTAC